MAAFSVNILQSGLHGELQLEANSYAAYKKGHSETALMEVLHGVFTAVDDKQTSRSLS